MSQFKRKFNKLKCDPHLFVSDMFTKHANRLKKHLPIKYKGHNQYTVVSAVYNVGKYLDDYFSSLTKQTLSFKEHIQLILVDDGSTDNSAEIIKKWQKRFPHNIHYFYKENGGISSARNLGLEQVKTKWVTFIDSDDFVHPDYFKIVDDTLHNDKSIRFAAGNLKFYFDKNKLVQDTHSLKYRFNKELNIVPINNLDNYINLFVTVSFFETEVLHKNKIRFDENIKPNFEDGKFLADYFLHTGQGNAAYLQKAVFFYRKRGDGSSTIDSAWQKKGKFSNTFSYGYIPMLQSYLDKYGYIPKNIQWTVLYELSWHLKTLLNNDYKLDILSQDEISNYRNLVSQTLSYIDDKQILDFNLIGIWFFYKVGIMGLKGKKTPFNIVYVENVDREKQQLLLVYQYTQDHDVSFRLNNKDIIPQYQKIVDYTFAKQVFVHEVRAWIPYDATDVQLTVQINGQTARLSVFGKQHNGWKVQDILNQYRPSEKYKTDGSWIIMDRDTQADDNGEHFYRYMKQHHSKQKCYFALNKNSHDWERLKKEGFDLLDFGSKDYEEKLRKASKIISGHFDEYVQDYFGDKYEHSKKFVFLQHGVIQNDLSRLLNKKRNMLAFVTSTYDEYNSIAQDHTHYHVGRKETCLIGLARHDRLLQGNKTNDKIILIMPTWRAGAIGKSTKTGNAREFNKEFMDTRYAQHWAAFLRHPKLKAMTEQYGYQIIFAPHANIQPYLPLFKLPNYIQTWQADNSLMGIQQLFQTASLMITDYSSVHFEMAFLNKPVLYYQFDKDEIYSGMHVIRKGYFDYETHGFGPVAENEETLLAGLEKVLQHGGTLLEPYLSRSRGTFPFRDGKNCERTYQAIQNMDKLDNTLQVDMLTEFTERAYRNHSWHVLEERSHQLKKLMPSEKYQQYYYLALFKQNKFIYLSQCLQKDPSHAAYWQAKISLHLNDIENSLAYFERMPSENLDDQLLCLIHAAAAGDKAKYQKFQAALNGQRDVPLVQDFIRLGDLLVDNQIDDFVKELNKLCETWAVETKREYKLELLAVKLLVAHKELKRADTYLSRYWKHTKHDPAYFLVAADMAFADNNHERVVFEILQGFKEHFALLSAQKLKKYAVSFRLLSNKLETLR